MPLGPHIWATVGEQTRRTLCPRGITRRTRTWKAKKKKNGPTDNKKRSRDLLSNKTSLILLEGRRSVTSRPSVKRSFLLDGFIAVGYTWCFPRGFYWKSKAGAGFQERKRVEMIPAIENSVDQNNKTVASQLFKRAKRVANDKLTSVKRPSVTHGKVFQPRPWTVPIANRCQHSLNGALQRHALDSQTADHDPITAITRKNLLSLSVAGFFLSFFFFFLSYYPPFWDFFSSSIIIFPNVRLCYV